MHNLHTQITTIYLAFSLFLLLSLIRVQEKTYVRVLSYILLPSFAIYIILMGYLK